MCPFEKSKNVTDCHHYNRKRLMTWPSNTADCKKIALSQEIESLRYAAKKLKQKVASLTPTEKNKNTSIPQDNIKGNAKSTMSCKMHVFISELREIKSILEESNEIVDKNIKRGKVITSIVRDYFEKPSASLNANENAKTKIGTMTKSKFGSIFLDYMFVLQTLPNIAFNVMPVSLTSYFESLSSGSTIGISESMSNNLLRLSSFSTFPRRVNIFFTRFTSAGFYFTGQSDTVKCYACGVSRSNWTSGDDPLKIHKQLSPNCPYLQKVPPQNITQNTASTVERNGAYWCSSEQNSIENCTQLEKATNETSNSTALARNNGYHEYNKRSEFHRTSNISGNELHVTQTNQSMAASNICKPEDLEDVHNLGVNLEKPKYPNYAPIQVRISSYQNWPGYLDQTPKMMATAGFLYAGYNDYTRCFFCGGGLRNWEAGDDPWVEHARWFPKCAYLLQNKGSKFIRVVQEKHQQVMAKHQNTENTEYNLSTQNSIKTNQKQNMTNGASSHPSGQNPLETVAARSVLEMGYTNDLVLQAMAKLKTTKKDTTISATDIMAVLLEENLEGSNLSTYSSFTTLGLALERNSATQSTSDKNTLESTNAIKSEISARENQKRSSLQLPSSQGAFGETSHSNELSSALDDTEQLLEENRQLRDQRLCKVCLDLEASIAFLPCGHLVCCADCAPAMRKCPICRARVTGTVKTFLI